VLKEFFQLRVAVEPEAAALAALHSTAPQRRAIADAIERMRHSPANSELAIAADVEFHIALLYATGNRFYIRLRDFVRTALNVSIHFTTPGTGGYEDTVDAHASILRAIEQGDVDRARSSTRALIDDALVLIEAGAGAAS
jgi:DNA-binding FadR family transcriptional regulator